MTTNDERVTVAHNLVANIRKYLGELTPEQWELPSACAGWQIRDVVTHLIGGAERQAASMERGLEGNPGPPSDFVPPTPAEISAGNLQRELGRREEMAGKMLDVFDQGYQNLHQVFAKFQPDGWDTMCWHVRRGSFSAADYVELRIQELAVHDWDIRSALDPDAALDPASLPSLLDMSPKWLGMCFRPGTKLPEPVVYYIEAGPAGSGPASRNYRVTVTGDEFNISEGQEPPVGLRLKASSGDYLLFAYGRSTGAEGLSSGRLVAEGDPALLDRFEEWFKSL